MKKALVIGIDSYLAPWIVQKLQNRDIRVIGTSRNLRSLTNDIWQLDLRDKLSVDGFLKRIDNQFFDYSIFLAAQTNSVECQSKPDESRLINVESPIRILKKLLLGKTVSIVLSTSSVFNSKNHFPKEFEIPEPRSQYGLQKYELERHIQELKFGKILRISKVLRRKNDFLSSKIDQLLVGSKVCGSDKMEVCPILPWQVAGEIDRILSLGSNQQQIFHYGTRDVISYYSALRTIAKHLNLDESLVSMEAKKDKISISDNATLGSQFSNLYNSWSSSGSNLERWLRYLLKSRQNFNLW